MSVQDPDHISYDGVNPPYGVQGPMYTLKTVTSTRTIGEELPGYATVWPDQIYPYPGEEPNDPFKLFHYDYLTLMKSVNENQFASAYHQFKSDDCFLVELEVPGVVENTVGVTIEGKTLTVTWDKLETKNVSGEKKISPKCAVFELSGDPDTETCKANLEAGMLVVSVGLTKKKVVKIKVDGVRKLRLFSVSTSLLF